MTVQQNDSFFDRVYRIVRKIQEGRVTSYGAIARALGNSGSSRIVGYAMRAASSVRPPIPAHRVVNRAGMLSGKQAFGSATLMQQLLENEGVRVVNDKIVDFDRIFWDPQREDLE